MALPVQHFKNKILELYTIPPCSYIHLAYLLTFKTCISYARTFLSILLRLLLVELRWARNFVPHASSGLHIRAWVRLGPRIF